MNHTPLHGTLAAVVGLGLAVPASGGICHWTLYDSGNWSNNDHWDPHEPLATDDARIDNGGTALITYSGETCRALYLGTLDDDDGIVRMTSGSLTLVETSYLSLGQDGTGFFHQSGGTVTGQQMVLGHRTGYGEYNLSGSGTLTFPQQYVGPDGIGEFNHDGGTNTSAYEIGIGGSWGEGTGYYDLADGTLDAVSVYVGDHGRGVFTQTGGAHTASDRVHVGRSGTGDGTYRLEGGSLSAHLLALGEGIALFHWTAGTLDADLISVKTNATMNVDLDWTYDGGIYQSGGVIDVRPHVFALDYVDALCHVEMSNGQFYAEDLTVGATTGPTRFTQSLGTTQVDDYLYVGKDASASGHYDLDGGTVTVGLNEHVGSYGTGTFDQTDGTHTISGVLAIGRYADSTGTYNLSGGTLTASLKYVGYGGTGTFNHTGGTNDPDLYIGYEPGAVGTYNLSGTGVLAADAVHVGYEGEGTFMQVGGTHESQVMYVGHQPGGVGLYDMGGGTLRTGALNLGLEGEGTLWIGGPAGEIFVSERLRLGPSAQLLADAGAMIHMTGAAFENQSVDAVACMGLGSLALLFEGGPQDVDPMEIGGRDYGRVWAGYAENFELRSLMIGGADVGRVELADQNDNRPDWVGQEAQYVEHLQVGNGSTLDLNGLNLYYVVADIDEGATIVLDGGALIEMPCYGDIDDDGTVGFSDILEILVAWGPCEGCPADLDASGRVDFADILIVLTEWGSC